MKSALLVIAVTQLLGAFTQHVLCVVMPVGDGRTLMEISGSAHLVAAGVFFGLYRREPSK